MYFNLKKGETEPHATAGISNLNEQDDEPVFRAKELLSLHDAGVGINFDLTKVLALECIYEILDHWLPDGKQQGCQYVAYNPTRDDGRLGSFQINTESGKWADFATEYRGGDLISLVAYVDTIGKTDAAVKLLQLIAGLRLDACASIVKRVEKEKSNPVTKLTPVMPVPSDARDRPTFFGSKLGSPSFSWEYRNEGGQLMFVVNRFNIDGGKEFRPLTYCADSSGHLSWRLQGPPAPRPAYGLDRLAARPDAPVLFTEGEKAADAAQRLFPDFVAVTTMNGAQSPEKTDFTPFAGRSVYIAPDNDGPGQAYMDKLIGLLRAAGAKVEASINMPLLLDSVPANRKPGFDLADAETDGWTSAKLNDLGQAIWCPISMQDELLQSSQPVEIPSFTVPRMPKIVETASKSKSAASSMSQVIPATAAAPKKRTQQEVARDFAERHHGGHLAAFNGQVVAYADGNWSPLIEDLHIKQPLLKMMGLETTASGVSRVVDLIKIQYAESPDTFQRNTSLICLNNGTLDPATGELLGHSYHHYLTNKVDITYDGSAECPLWLQTLEEIFAPDFDKADKIQFLQEFIGYCLIPSTVHTKFLWLVGAGGNGKSVILSIITALIGKPNISYAQIEHLDKSFVRAELQGKLVNISAEMSASATQADSFLKSVVSGDLIQAERKFRDPFSFKPYCRVIGATNTLPRLLDHSDGFTRRAVIMQFNRQFKEVERDVNREAKLMAELPGILNWALTGLQNLNARGSFVTPASSIAELSEYRLNSDPIRQFSEQILTPTNDRSLWIGGAELYQNYREWSNENGYNCLAANQFAGRLQAIGIDKTRTSSGNYWSAQYRDKTLQVSPVLTPRRSGLAARFSL